jgi:hypothetical protein
MKIYKENVEIYKEIRRFFKGLNSKDLHLILQAGVQ